MLNSAHSEIMISRDAQQCRLRDPDIHSSADSKIQRYTEMLNRVVRDPVMLNCALRDPEMLSSALRYPEVLKVQTQ